jgi:hypothetical protein
MQRYSMKKSYSVDAATILVGTVALASLVVMLVTIFFA